MAIELTTTLEEVKTRGQQTRAVQDTLSTDPGWVWPELTLVQWDEHLRQFDPQSIAPEASLANKVKQAGMADTAARNALDLQVSSIALTLRAGLAGLRGLARTTNNEDLADDLDGITAKATSRTATIENATDLLEVWEEYNVNWSPGSPHSSGALKAMLGLIPGLVKTYRKTTSDLAKAEKALRHHAQLVEDLCMAWYETATGFFAAGTVPGDLIRGNITVSTSGPGPLAPGQPGAPTAQALNNGRLYADGPDAAGASRYFWYTKGPGDATFVRRAETTTSEALLLGLTPGLHELRFTGANSGGESVPSAVISVTVL
jgi:hypothetical protein